MYDTSYYSSSYSVSPTAAAGGLDIGVIGLIIYLAVMVGAYLLGCFLLSRIFKKAGVKTSIAFIPIYNQWKFLEIGDQKGFWIFVPGANVIFPIIAAYNIGKKLGKEDWFVALYIFLPIVWIIMLGFDKSTWNGGASTIDPFKSSAPAEAAPVAAAPTEPAAPVYTEPSAPTYAESTTPEPAAPIADITIPTASETPVTVEPMAATSEPTDTTTPSA